MLGKDGVPRCIETEACFLRGGIAVTLDIGKDNEPTGRWGVTHAPSGMALTSGAYAVAADALDLAERLLALGNWDRCEECVLSDRKLCAAANALVGEHLQGAQRTAYVAVPQEVVGSPKVGVH